MVSRKEYLNQLLSWKDEQIIKVVTGIRRCGKSTLFELYKNKLLESGISASQIISLNFESPENDSLQDYKSLYNHVKSRLSRGKMTYVFLDEVQMVQDFQKAVDGLFILPNVDIYITGSNAYLLSGELGTLLSGRYVEIKMLPLSFSEYCEANPTEPKEKLFESYLKFGGLPYVAKMHGSEQKVQQYIEGIYNTIIIKDVEERGKRKNGENRKIADIALLKSISKYLASVVGSPVSIKGISDYLTSNNRKVSPNTVSNYVEALIEAFVFYPAARYNIQGKEELKSNQKYYVVDMGLRNHLVNKSTKDLGYMLENVVYLELKRRGYQVYVGKFGTREVDFVAEKNGVREYYQVSASLTNEETFNREITPLREIKDNYQKTILTLDSLSCGNYDGIVVSNIIDWL